MPTVAIPRDDLFAALGRSYTQDEFDELCFAFGIELDEVVTAAELAKTEAVDESFDPNEVIYKIEIAANRYDLLCLEGLAAALRTFNGDESPQSLSLTSSEASPEHEMFVEASTAQIRPFVVCAILRGVEFDSRRYRRFIDLQDKLHRNICAKRKLVAIGTHDLSKLKGPFRYKAVAPGDLSFVPLNQEEKMDGNRLMEFYESHQQLKAYLHIIRDSPVYPIIYDSNDVVLSLPPIINGDHSKIGMQTRDVFIEATALDQTKADIVLNTLVACFAKYCKKPFTVEPVRVTYERDHAVLGGQSITFPRLEQRKVTSKRHYLVSLAGVPESMSADDVCKYLRRMTLPSRALDAETIETIVPVTRSDILDPCDLAEDLAIAYGYNNIPAVVPETVTWPAEQPLNHLSDLVRQELRSMYYECLTWGLCSYAENFENMRREPREAAATQSIAQKHEYDAFARPVKLSSPKTREFEVVRTSLLPMLLKTIAANRHRPPPLRLFEVSDVCVLDETSPTGSRNIRRVCASISGLNSLFEHLHGTLDALMCLFGIDPSWEVASEPEKKKNRTFQLVEGEDPAFLTGRQAAIVVDGLKVGVIGVVHPDVLAAFDIDKATSMLEVNLEPFLQWLEAES